MARNFCSYASFTSSVSLPESRVKEFSTLPQSRQSCHLHSPPETVDLYLVPWRRAVFCSSPSSLCFIKEKGPGNGWVLYIKDLSLLTCLAPSVFHENPVPAHGKELVNVYRLLLYLWLSVNRNYHSSSDLTFNFFFISASFF